jgi:hypothetical protein
LRIFYFNVVSADFFPEDPEETHVICLLRCKGRASVLILAEIVYHLRENRDMHAETLEKFILSHFQDLMVECQIIFNNVVVKQGAEASVEWVERFIDSLL